MGDVPGFSIVVKTASRPRLDDTDGLNAFLDEYPDAAPHGILIHAGDTVERLAPRIWAVPLSLAVGIADKGVAAGSERERRL